MPDNQRARGGCEVLLDGPHVVLLVRPLGRAWLRLRRPDVAAVGALLASITAWVASPAVFLC